MKRTSIKKLFIVLAVVAILLLVVSNSAFAAGEIINPFQVNQTATNTTTDVTANTTQVNTVANITTANTVTNTNTNLPQTGDASDYVLFTFIIVAAVVAIYAYKKVKHYNI